MKTLAFSRHWDSLSAEECRELQLSRLRWFLKRKVLPFSEFYRRHFREAGLSADSIRRFDDWEKVPFTNKADLQPNPRDFLLVPDAAILRRQPSTLARAFFLGKHRLQQEVEAEFRPVLMTSTTGRSSLPVPFLYTLHDVANLEEAGRRMMVVCNSRREFRHVNLFPFAPHLAFWQAHYAGTGFGTFCTSTGGGKVMGTEGNVALIDKVQPDALIGMPTFIYHVLTQALADDRHWPKICRIVLGGEKVPDGLRRKLKALCAHLGAGNVDVMATYGFTEAKMAFPECPSTKGSDATGYHLSPDLGLVEIVDPNGHVLGPGQGGEIVYTALDSRGSVVLRYRTGDVIDGGLVYEACPHCGRTCPRLLGKISRISDVHHLNLDKIKGTLVDFNELEHILDDVEGIGAWQIEIAKRNDDPMESDELIIHASLTGTLNEMEAERLITRRLRESTELRPNSIHFHSDLEMRERQEVGRALKERKILDRRKESGRGAMTIA